MKHFFCLSSFCNFYDISMDAGKFSAVFHKFSLYIPQFNAEILLGNAAPGDSSECSSYSQDICTVGHDIGRCRI